MSDAKCLKDLGIPIRIDGSTRFIKGATKYTTCGDVIKMVLKKTGIQKEYRHLFSIYEVTRDGERALSCKTRIMNEIKKWNDENNRFVLRKVDPIGQRPFMKETHQTKVVRVITSDKRVQIETSGSESSDTSFEDFLSKVDHIKLANFMKLFKVMTSGEENKQVSQRESTPEAEPPLPPRQRSSSRSRRRRSGQGQTRRKIKQSRRSRSSHNLQDRHPNKMYRVDYGYVDKIPQGTAQIHLKRVPTMNQDSVKDFLNVEHNDQSDNRRKNEPKSKKGARRILPFTKYLLPGKRKKGDVCSKEKSKVQVPEVKSNIAFTNLDNDFRRVGGFQVLDDCREIWDDKMRQEVDSGQDDSSDISANLCAVTSPSIDSYSSDMSICADVLSEKEKGWTNVQSTKLVDYSISSDDEYEDDDDDEFCKSYDKDLLNSRISDTSNYYSNEGSHNCDIAGICDVTEFIKGVFSKKNSMNEDEEMDSFMKSKIYDDSSDEGVSSLESGLDHVHL